MKKIKISLILICTLALGLIAQPSFSQFKNPIKKLKEKSESRANENVDTGIEKGLDGIEKGVGNIFKKKEKQEPADESQIDSDSSSAPESQTDDQVISVPESQTDNQAIPQVENPMPDLLTLYSKYDFVPGDTIIFEDNLITEQNGEFPSRWDLVSGSAEVASLAGENVIHFSNYNSIIIPLMIKKDFLPDVFTIEFDVFFEKEGASRSDIYSIRFFEGTANSKKIEDKVINVINIRWNEVKMGQFGSNTSSFLEEKANWVPKWKHVALSFNKRALKVYLDEEKLLNIPNLDFQPKMFSIGGHFDNRFIKMSSIKNIRVNEGGLKLYDRIMAEGKFVTRGILFDVNKSTLKPESMGVINEIYNLLSEHSDLNFSIEGHTDSDGDESSNLKLSEDRAATVKKVLIERGIDAPRLSAKGWGENQPVDSNNTPEGKANNRRVEFVKI